MDLIANLLCEQENRLSSRRYRYSPAANSNCFPPADYTGRAVYSHDAEDIKAHKWFRDLPWDQLHQLPPPFIPQISSLEDTHYFDEEEPISDWSESQSEGSMTSQDMVGDYALAGLAALGGRGNPGGHPTMFSGTPASTGKRSGALKAAAMQAELATFPPHWRGMMAHFVATPYDPVKLKRMDQEMEGVAMAAAYGGGGADAAAACAKMKAFVREYGRRERKRPRDRLLRDRRTRGVALKVRKQTAFLGYTYRRRRFRPRHHYADHCWDPEEPVVHLPDTDPNPRSAGPYLTTPDRGPGPAAQE